MQFIYDQVKEHILAHWNEQTKNTHREQMIYLTYTRLINTPLKCDISWIRSPVGSNLRL